jgi:serine/threonine-protein kinase
MAPHQDTFVIALEHEDGAVLEDRLKRLNSFQTPAALTTAISVAEALDACHQAGLVHGDVSSRNIYSKQSDGIKLMCAGYWRAYSVNAFAARQALPAMAPYLAPEITAGEMPSPSSDIYAMGVLFFRLLSGRYPYMADTPAGMAQMHATALPPSLRRTNASVPQALDHVILKCLSKNPQDRYTSAGGVVRDLRMIQDSLRFGKPIKTASEPARPIITASTPSAPDFPKAEPVKVRPVVEPMAQSPAPQDVKSQEAKEKEDGLPKWLAFMGYLAILCTVLTVVWWAYFNLSTPPTRKVPNLVGENVQQAAERLRALGLNMETQEKASDKPMGVILALSPAPGEEVRENYPIRAIVSAGSAQVEVPDLRGRTLDEAKQLLATLGLEISQEVEFDYDGDLRPNLIMKQRPDPKTTIQRMSRIRVVVNTGVRGQGDRGTPSRWHRYKITIPLPDPGGNDDLNVRVELTDDDGAVTVHSGQHRPGEVIGVTVTALGKEVFFRVYINDDLWDQVSKAPPAAREEEAVQEEEADPQ